MPSHSWIFFCLVPFCVNQLQKPEQHRSHVETFHTCMNVHVFQAWAKPFILRNSSYIKYWSLILRSCMRSGLRLFIFLSISRLSETCCLRSCSSLHLLSWISFTRDFKRSELLWILIWKEIITSNNWNNANPALCIYGLLCVPAFFLLPHPNPNLLLNLLFVAFPLESLQRLSAVAFLGLTLLLKNLDGLIESLNGCALHLQLLWKMRRRQTFKSSYNENSKLNPYIFIFIILLTSIF